MEGKKTLSEQILALSTPKPVSFHPDQDFLEDDTAAKLCDFSYEQQEEEERSLPQTRAKIRRRHGIEPDEDPKYAGRVVSRRELEGQDSSTPDEGEQKFGGV